MDDHLGTQIKRSIEGSGPYVEVGWLERFYCFTLCLYIYIYIYSKLPPFSCHCCKVCVSRRYFVKEVLSVGEAALSNAQPT